MKTQNIRTLGQPLDVTFWVITTKKNYTHNKNNIGTSIQIYHTIYSILFIHVIYTYLHNCMHANINICLKSSVENFNCSLYNN